MNLNEIPSLCLRVLCGPAAVESVRGPRKTTTENPACRNHFWGIIGGIIILILALDVLFVLFGAYLNGNAAR